MVAGKDSDTVPSGTLSSIRRATGLEHLRMSEYVVVFEQAKDGGWGAYLPDLPGVVALGPTRETVEGGISEALSAYARELAELGQAMPAPAAKTGTVEAV